MAIRRALLPSAWPTSSSLDSFSSLCLNTQFSRARQKLTATIGSARNSELGVGVDKIRRVEALNNFYERQKRKNSFHNSIMCTSRLARSVHRPHEQRQIARRSLN